jgi:hypothetical protein
MHGTHLPVNFGILFLCDTTCLQDVLGQTLSSGFPYSLETPVTTTGPS